jgi:hypothetical protein
MRRYVGISDYQAPFDGAHYLQGLGASPAGRSYWSVAHFRSPYDEGYFQDNTLRGTMDDVKVALRQVPTWGYVLGGLALGFVAYKASKRKG